MARLVSNHKIGMSSYTSQSIYTLRKRDPTKQSCDDSFQIQTQQRRKSAQFIRGTSNVTADAITYVGTTRRGACGSLCHKYVTEEKVK